MSSLDNLYISLFSGLLDKFKKPESLYPFLIKRWLKELGVDLSEDQKEKIKQQFIDTEEIYDGKSVELPLTDEQEKLVVASNKKTIDFDEFDIEKIIEELGQKGLTIFIDLVAKDLIEEWKQQSGTLLAEIEKEHSSFKEILSKEWNEPIDLLKMLLDTSLDAIVAFHNNIKEQVDENNVDLFEALSRLFARAHQTVKEIILLLENGYADGANARWRTLHEIDVESTFLHRYGNSCATKFLDHIVGMEYKRLKMYQKYHQQIDGEPLDQNFLNEMKKEHDKLINLHGPKFFTSYGWAAQELSKDQPYFTNLEKHVDMDKMRPMYMMANMNVHSGSSGAHIRLGLLSTQNDILLAGSSIYGIGEVGKDTAFSFGNIAKALLSFDEKYMDLEVTTRMKAIQLLANETFAAFVEVDHNLHNEGS